MLALAICGSPRVNGNTQQLLHRCLDGIKRFGIDVELISLSGKKIHPCVACGHCSRVKNGSCSLDDDFTSIYKKLIAADIIIVGSPVYFGSATPETMALLDRTGYVQRASGFPLSRKVGASVAVARRAGQNFTFAQLLYWFLINDMIVPGSTYWNIGFGLGAGDIQNDLEALQTIDRLAENLAWTAQKLTSDRSTGN